MTATAMPAPPQTAAASNPAVATNGIRLTAVAEKLASHFHGSLTLSTPELSQLCYALARGIDYALSSNDVPWVAQSIPVLIKKMFHHKNESELHSALMVLIISAKNACNKGWFQEDDKREILALANEFASTFCLSVSQNPDAIDTLAAISEITPRFYPQIKLTKLIVSFEAKPGYDILMSDFFIQRNIPSNEKIRLYVIQRGNLDTSCITQPPLVSFLVNGKGIEKRNNVAMETGPQLPTDITKMLKYGTNIIQAAGYFKCHYIVAIAFTSTLSIASPNLQDYTEPSSEIESDSEIIEGPSTVSLNCPISFGRIKTPVKGSQCRHPQCFDYNNYMEINSRKPIWRCPHCYRPACALDIRLDQKMVKILKEVDNDASHITILSDGSWKKVDEHDKNQQSNCTLEENNNSKGDASNDIIDLTSEVNDVNEPIDIEDTKPILDCQVSSTGLQGNTVQHSQPQTSIFHAAEDNVWLRNSFSPAYGTLESLLPDSLRSHTGPSSLYLQQEIQRQSGPLRMPSVPRQTMQIPGSTQAPPTQTGNPSRRILLHPPSAATVTVAANGNFASPLGSMPSSFVAPQQQSQNQSQNQTPANRTYQPTMNLLAQRPTAPASSAHRGPTSLRVPILNSSNPSANNLPASMPSHQPLFPPVRMPTSIQGGLRTHTQPSSTTLSENQSGLAQSAVPQTQPEQDWTPGRMRGSLTGQAYSAALNNYLVANSPNPGNNSNPNLNPRPNTSGSNAPSTLGQTVRRWYQ